MTTSSEGNDGREGTANPPSSTFGPYRLIAKLGAGGAGEVHRAEDSRNGAIVALKILRREWLSSSRERERFAREAEAARRVDHPNCARLLDAGEHEGRPYVVYEFTPGMGLDEVIRQRRADPGNAGFESVLRWGEHLAEALAALHDAGLVHRDVKPGNVRVTADGRAILLDFGLAAGKGLGTVTRTGEFAGSLPYAPPEQIRHGASAVDARADVYALGATLSECATGVPIHSGASREQVILAAVRDDPVPPSRLDASLPRAFDLVIGRALEKDPAHRYPTMREFLADLSALRRGAPVAARPRGTWRTFFAAIRKRPRTGAAGIAAGLILVIAPTALYLHESSTRQRIERERANTAAAIDHAEKNLARALEAIDSMLAGASAPDLRGPAGPPKSVIAMLEDACENYERLARANPDDPAVNFGLAHALRRRAVLALRGGELDLAEGILERIVPMGRRLVELDPGSADYHIDLADSLQARSDLRILRGDRAGCDADIEEGIAMFEVAARLAPDRLEPPRGIASFRNSHALQLQRRGELELAQGEFEASIEAMERVVAITNAIEDFRARAQAMNNLAALHAAAGRQDDAIAAYRDVLAVHDRLLEVSHGDREVRLDRASGMQNLAVAYFKTGQVEESVELGERIVAECEGLLVEEPGSASVERVLGLALTQLAGGFMRLGRHDECDATHDRAVATARRLIELDPHVPRYLADEGLALANRAIHHQQRKRVDEARADFERSLERFDRALAIAPEDVSWSGLRAQIAGLAAKLPPPADGETP